ncbi:MAG: hypothetical protein A4S09_16905 [Proteobacteria bacterium SG_bin7]|nr:MAG: hypothetical protein A4S09_16905 [Proteobacteria bacterium SG_bin7]
MLKYVSSFIFIFYFLLGCTADFYVNKEGKSLVYNPLFNSKLDILLVVDNSGSMEKHQEYLANSAPGLTSRLESLGFDFQIAVTSTDLSQQGQRGRFVGDQKILASGQPQLDQKLRKYILLGSQGSSQEEGLGAAKRALSSPLVEGENAGFLRSDAFLIILILSNENDYSSDKAQDYVDFFNELKPPLEGRERGWMLNFIGVTGAKDENCTTFGDYKDVGYRYLDLVRYSGGQAHTICTTNLKNAVDNVQKVLLTLLTEIILERVPDVETIKVYFNNVEVPKDEHNGWSYRAEKNSVIFHGTFIPKTITKINIFYTPVAAK